MSFTKPKTRTSIGTLRKVSLSTESSSVKLPPLTKDTSGSSLQNGLQGNAMAVPPAKESPEPRRSSREDVKSKEPKTPTRASYSSKSDQFGVSLHSAEVEKFKRELRESNSREKDLKKQIESLTKTIAELTEQIENKEKVIHDLQLQFDRQVEENKEEYYKDMYERECRNHEDTNKQLTSTNTQLESKIQEVHNLHEAHEVSLKEMKETHEQQIDRLRKEKEEEITLRDQKLNKLKTQMADALSGNSWERQQQLDELSKELTRTQEEADMLRMKIKSLQKSTTKSDKNKIKTKHLYLQGNGSCQNCDINMSKLKATQKSVTEKDKYITELKSMCSKFEKQLTQQDSLLKQFSESHGHKVTILPK